MRAAVVSSTNPDTRGAAQEAIGELRQRLGDAPHWLVVQASVLHDVEVLQQLVHEAFPHAPVHGGTSCLGVLTQDGFQSSDGVGLGLFGIVDDDGAFGVGAAELGDDPAKAGAEAVRSALAQAGRPGEMPALLWVGGAPGKEEAMLSGIESVVGSGIPIVGGSTADNTVEGHWKQFTLDKVSADCAVVSALFPSASVTSTFQSGYSPTKTRGVVTKASGRILHTIDGKPAAVVYNDWTEGAVSDALEAGGNVLSKTTLYPLGCVVGEAGDLPYYRLIHPDGVTPDKALTLFADVAEGDELILMRGSVEGLSQRGVEVAEEALAQSGVDPAGVAGCLVVFCAGCMLTIQERMPQVAQGLAKALDGVPTLGLFTFGEQGCFLGGENRQGNLMISVTVFHNS